MGRLRDKAAWHRRARRQLQYEPLCAMCLSEGKIVAARIADHVEPHHNDPIKFWNGKLQSLCAHCHEGRKKRLEHRGLDNACCTQAIFLPPSPPAEEATASHAVPPNQNPTAGCAGSHQPRPSSTR
jgi:HNH endonuclease